MKRTTFIVVIAMVLFVALLTMLTVPKRRAAEINVSGEWELAEIRTAGIYGGSLETAQALVGRTVSIHDEVLISETGADCPMPPLASVTLRDDMETFGTSGGSWSELGLAPTGEGRTYPVLAADLECDGPFTSIIVQPERDLYLLGHNEIYLLLRRR